MVEKAVGVFIFVFLLGVIAFALLTVPDSSTPRGSGDRAPQERIARP